MHTESTPSPEDERANEALLSGDGLRLLDHVLAWSLRNRLLVIAPDGTRYAIVVMLGSTTASIPQRMALMQAVSGAVAEFHGN